MLKFFRKIRQKLLSENPPDGNGRAGKFSKYLLYAIGEIILVVIGILIALQINNWNNFKIERSKEDSYLVNLKRDFSNQLEVIERNLSGEEYTYNSLTQAKSNFEKHKVIRAVKEDLVLIASINDRYTFTITSPTYTELLSTGNIDVITNKSFKTQMIKYYEDLKLTSQVIQKNNDYKDNVVNSKALSIIEIVGGSDKGSTYTGIQTTFKNYETQDEVMTIIKTNLSKSENQLTLLNLIRMRRLNAEIHMDHLKKAKNQTEVLLNQLETLNK